ncbi:hypothetical protein CC1G_12008 [Coprinopsis cinerea okayama7|uniref:F-box domain-containing protein n=1 Tax=Coprinopsis cinerea (strain Okayama-7 / 130 / ATCC MYA-4618 / FGSC 9003) TaxID=240176 RepID=A8N103_COPC7|nr:hypothetical protein CC1G_12008 [Coprinopsis cinerea okayama7\|eukprot:XP_001828560.2 hypothetical protein CC1G_12008 [Coprinopsis cinerea okayama7\
MSLLQDVLRSHTSDALQRHLDSINISGRPPPTDNDHNHDSDGDDFINVVSLPNSPGATRPSSPTRNSSKPIKGPLLLSNARKDPLRRFPTEVSQRIFKHLSISDLAHCSRVSKKWNRSQTLNYVWFQHYRKENFHDESLPPGKWTRRESKQNWRLLYIKTLKDREPPTTFSRASMQTSPLQSGQQTPRERREEQWRQEAAAVSKPGKLEMREMYKELGGRKARGKTKLGSQGATRDKGGWNDSEDW